MTFSLKEKEIEEGFRRETTHEPIERKEKINRLKPRPAELAAGMKPTIH